MEQGVSAQALDDRGEPVGTHYFGCRLTGLVTLMALGPVGEAYLGDFARRHTEFVSSLINCRDERLTYDLRIVARPDAKLFTRGRVSMGIIGRMEAAANAQAMEAGRQLFNLLTATYAEFDTEMCSSESLAELRQPFAPQHVLTLTRRFGWQPLDSIRGEARQTRHVGFLEDAAREAPQRPVADASVFYVFPFSASFAAFAGLFHFLLLQEAPICLSVRLRPTALQPGELEFLVGQMARCEKYAQLGVGPISDDVSYLRPTLQQQARLFQERQLRVLHGLSDDAALIKIALFSPAPIPMAVADVVGHFFTEPAGMLGVESGPARYLAGGYDVSAPADVGQELEAFKSLDLPLEGPAEMSLATRRLPHLFDAWEAAAVFRLPFATMEPPPGVAARLFRRLPPPADLPADGTLLGSSRVAGVDQSVHLADPDRLRHVYVVGQTGTGKSTMLRTMLLDDIRRGHGVCLIDPHGDLLHDVLQRIPRAREDDVLLIDPTDVDYPVGLNLLECTGDAQRYFVAQEMVGIITKLMTDEYGSEGLKYLGPIFFQHMRMNLLLITNDPERPATLVDLYRIFSSKTHWQNWVPLKTDDPDLRRWVEEVLPRTDYTSPGSEGISMGGYLGSKFEEFVFDPMLRGIFGQARSTVNLRSAMDDGKVVLVNLAKGAMTEATARFFGMIVLAKLQAAAMSRIALPAEKRRPFFVYVDEFQSVATANFISILSEGRKFGLGLVLANQFVSQLEDQRVVESVFGNVGTLVTFRVGRRDAELLARYFAPAFSESDLGELPNWDAIVSLQVRGEALPPFSVSTVLPEESPDRAAAERVRARSRDKYARRPDAEPKEQGAATTRAVEAGATD